MRLRIVCRSTMKPTLPRLPADVLEAEEIEGSGLPRPARFRSAAAWRPNSKSLVLSGCSSSWNFSHTFFQFRPEPFGIVFELEPNQGVIGVTHHDHRPRRTPVKLAFTLHRMLPSASCQGVGVLKLGVFRGSIAWPVVPPVNASYPALRPCPHDSEPVWFARPSPYDSFIRYILPACTVQSASRSLKVVATALKEHGAYASDVGAATRHPRRVAAGIPCGNCAGTLSGINGLRAANAKNKAFTCLHAST